MKLAIATATALDDPDPDHEPLTRALEQAGVDFEWLAWDDPKSDFKRCHMTILRSTWNYVHKRDAFLTWIDTLGMRLVNPPVVVRWNTHKRYLRELDDAGLPVVDTVMVPRASGATLSALMKKKKWFKAVTKPAVGASSFNARIVGGSDDDNAFFDRLLGERDMLVQPYMPEVETSGERSIMMIEGEPTHAIRKARRFAGDPESITSVPIADDEAALARSAMAWVERALPCGKLLYGRVDMVRDDSGRPRIMELELVEPSLFFSFSEAALSRYVEGVKWRMATLGNIR